MNILILISSFYMGGFSKSLLNFLKCVEPYNELNVDILALEKSVTGQEKEIPKRFSYIEFDGLNLKEPVKKGVNAHYLFNKQRFRNLEYKLREWICSAKGKTLSQDVNKRFIQYSWIDKAHRVLNDLSFASEYDCVVSWEEGFCNYLLVDKIPCKHKIGYIHPNYKEINMSKKVDNKYIKKLDRIVTISQSCYDTLVGVFPKYRDKIIYLPNRLHIDTLNGMADEYTVNLSSDRINILTVARIVDYDKAVFRIVRLAKRLKTKGFDFTWYIIGNGEDYAELQSRIISERLEDTVICLGEKNNPCPYMRNADLFVMQSNREGRPVAVDEALALGTPALITRYSSAAEQIDDGVTGWIVDNNEEDIYQKLCCLLSKPQMIDHARICLEKQDNRHYEDCTGFIEMIKDVIGS